MRLAYLFLVLLAVFPRAPLGTASALAAENAQFVQTSPGVLQSADGRVKVIAAYQSPGVFVLLGPPIELQLFDPGTVKTPEALKLSPTEISHLFVAYDPALDRYTGLHVGSQEFRIKGGFTLNTGDENSGTLRITVDNNNPYMSVVYEPPHNPSKTEPVVKTEPVAKTEPTPSILGFRGVDPIVNKLGQRHVALLEANQFNQFKGIIEPYSLQGLGVYFKGQVLRGAAVGVDLEPQRNNCLRQGTAILARGEIAKLKATANKEQRAKALEQLLARPSGSDAFKGYLLLRVEAGELIALDYSRDKVVIVRPLPVSSRPVCVAEEVPL